MSFPKRYATNDDTQIHIEQKYLVEKYELVLDRERCVSCGQCAIVCTHDAIVFHPPEKAAEHTSEETKVSMIDYIDENKCIYCGVCTIFCPFDAIHLYKNGEKVETEKLRVNEFHSLPHLEKETKNCTKLNREGQVFWEGEIKVKYEFPDSEEEFKDYYENKCYGSCKHCVDNCPTEAISFDSVEDSWKSKVLIKIDDEKCIHCGSCQNVCPQEHYEVIWTKIKTTGPFNQIFWIPMREKLLKQKVIYTPESK